MILPANISDLSPRLAALLLVLIPSLATARDVEGLPDFSRAGYRAGEAEPPTLEPTVPWIVEAGVDGEAPDITQPLREAIARASEKGGVIRVPEGRWTLTAPVEIRRSGVVLRGAGSGRTTIVCPRSLADVHGPKPGWSWSGGFLRVAPARGESRRLGAVREAAAEGAVRLAVALEPEREPPAAGEWLELLWHNDEGEDTLLDTLYGGVIPPKRMGEELRAAGGPRVREWVQVRGFTPGEEPGSGTLQIVAPLRLPVRPEWRPTLVRRPHIEEVGIEGLTIEFPETEHPGHLKERGYNALDIGGAIDCWVRDVVVENADSGVFVRSSRQVTVEGVVLRGRTMHHPLSLSWSSDCLVTRWRIEAPHIHGTTLSWAAHGNVFSEGYGRNLAMDCHRAAPFDNLHTAIVAEYDGERPRPFRSGGSRPRGPHSARRNVYWNVEMRLPEGEGGVVPVTGHAEWPHGVFVGWWGNRELSLGPTPGLDQRVVGLNRRPEIRNLHRHQVAAGR